MSDLTINLRQC